MKRHFFPVGIHPPMASGVLTYRIMSTIEHQWEKSTFVGASHVIHRPRNPQRSNKRLSNIFRMENVLLGENPVEIGAKPEKIRVAPVMEQGQIKALHVTCACGCEATFDIQYATGETPT